MDRSGTLLSGLLLCALASSLVLVRPAAAAGEKVQLIVSAAASLTDAFRDLKAIYLKDHPGQDVALNLAASGVLEMQIERGAPADIFASAGLPPMKALLAHGLVDTQAVRIFARNELVLVLPPENGRSPFHSLDDLASAGIQRIALGDTATVPAGKYAVQSLRSLGLYARVKGKLVPAQDVRQVLEYVATGAVDAGFVYASDVGQGTKVRVGAHIPDAAHDPILYVIAPVKAGEQQEKAREFLDLVLSPRGRDVLLGRGFLAPPGAEAK
jgi:molybdate transport system substrate-binding protein